MDLYNLKKNKLEEVNRINFKLEKEIQTLDVWESMGIAEEMCLGTIVKYAMRYGKKDGKNKKDLLKIIHYAILALHYGGHGETYTEQNK